MHVVTSSHAITVLARAALDDVATGVSRLMVVSDVLGGGSHSNPSGKFGMNRGLSLLLGGLCEPLRGGLASPRGRALGLLQGSGLEEFSDLISSPASIEV
jgi:hypothetical protein